MIDLNHLNLIITDHLYCELPTEILNIEGMSTTKVRQLINSICHLPSAETYLEIGSFKGSTLISAAYNNKHLKWACGIDNFSEHFNNSNYDTIKNSLLNNITLFKDSSAPIR